MNNASPYWQAVYWDKGKTYRRTTKTTDKLTAYDNAKMFYEMLILKKYQHPVHLQQHVISEANKPVDVVDHSFREIATQWIELHLTFISVADILVFAVLEFVW